MNAKYQVVYDYEITCIYLKKLDLFGNLSVFTKIFRWLRHDYDMEDTTTICEKVQTKFE